MADQRDRLEEYLSLIEAGPASSAETLLADEVQRLRAALDMVDSDMHRISSRPCRTCHEVTKAVGKPFGCAKRDRG